MHLEWAFMSYVPGTIVALFGLFYLVRALFAKNPTERNRFLLNAGIDFAIAIAIFVIYSQIDRG